MTRRPALVLTSFRSMVKEGEDNNRVSNCQGLSTSNWLDMLAFSFRAVEIDIHWPWKTALWPTHREAGETEEPFSAKYNFRVCSNSFLEGSCLSRNSFKCQWQALKDPGESARESLICAWSDQDISWISEPVQALRLGALTKKLSNREWDLWGGSKK